MKKTILALSILAGFAASGFSQGFVYFTGGASNGTKVSTNNVTTGRTEGDNSFYYALFASSSQTTINGSATAFMGTSGTYVFQTTGWTLVGVAGATTTLSGAGTFGALSQGSTSANQAAINSDTSLTVTGIAGGTSGNFVVVGWSSNIGSTVAAMETWYNSGTPSTFGLIGESRIGIGLTLGDNGSNPTQNVMGTGSTGVNAFTLGAVTPVPEPGTMALAALGGVSLLMFRRKK